MAVKETQILIAQDDPPTQRLLTNQLDARGYRVRLVTSGEEALRAVADREPSVVLLDQQLIDADGLDVCQQLRLRSQVPIIMLSSSQSPACKIRALDRGADDFVTKPFHMGELVARIQAVTRRRTTTSERLPTLVEVGPLCIDLPAREARIRSRPVHLTKIEFSLLRELAIHLDQVLPYEHLLREVWGPSHFDIRPIHVHMCNLRRKLQPAPRSPHYIAAVAGVGYRLQSHPEVEPEKPRKRRPRRQEPADDR